LYTVKVDAKAGTKYAAGRGIELGVFTINSASLSDVKAMIADTAWTGKQLRPLIKLSLGDVSINTKLSVTMSYGTNKNIGVGTVKLTGKGNFSGTKTVSFNIVPKKNRVSRITVARRQMRVTWKKVSKAQKVTKYEVRYRAKGTSKWKTKSYKASASSATIKNLTKGKAYQVQIRSYKTVSGRKFYSTWSAVKTSKKVGDYS
jgi:hypothetical protein